MGCWLLSLGVRGVKILVVSGFLGAGKTTFIQELARRSGRDFVVYENEYGRADIDARVLSETDELSVWESTENCICCSGKQDFATSVLTIANTLDPEYLVVEPTGVAKLSSILDNIGLVSYERLSVLPSVAIVDATAWERQRARFQDIYLDQVQTASTIVVSKAQHAGAGEVEELARWLNDANPEADISRAPWNELDDAWFSGLLTRKAAGQPEDRPHSPAGIATGGAPEEAPELESLSLSGIELPSESHLLWFLDALVAGVFGEVPRAKGYLPCGGQWLRFDVVDRAWSVTGYEPSSAAGIAASESGCVPAPTPDAAGPGSAPGSASGSGAPKSVGVFIGPRIRRPWLREVLVPVVRDAARHTYLTPRERLRRQPQARSQRL